MELTQIKYFVAVAQCENMSRAAGQLHISQPSLSRAISKLEGELGCKLLDRNGRHISLNDEGRRFLKGALSMIRELDDATFDVQEMAQAPVARLTVGITGNNSTLTGILMAFARLHPEVRFHLQCNIEAIENIDINRYDMLVYPQGERYKKFKGVELGTNPFLLAVGKKHPLYDRLARSNDALRAGMHVADLSEHDFVFIRHGDEFIEMPYELCLGAAMHPRVQVFTNSQDMHRQVVAAGDALGFVAQGSAGAYFADPEICLVPLLDKGFQVRLMVCFKRDKHLSSTGKDLREYVLGHIGR
jgi:LysR family transcriptional activator of glutamate synthase operon